MVDGIAFADTQLREFNENFVQQKQLNNSMTDAAWKNLEQRVTPILHKTPPLAPVSQISESEIVKKIEKKVGAKLRVRSLKLYQILESLPGVDFSENKVSVDGRVISDSLGSLIDNLIKPQSMLIYDCALLIEKAKRQGFAPQLEILIQMTLI